MSNITADFDPIATILAARQRQIQSQLNMRSSMAQSPIEPAFIPQNSGSQQYNPYDQDYPRDSVTLGGNSWSWGSPTDTRLANGQTIEELFANPYADDPEMAAIMENIAKLAKAGRLNNTKPQKEAQKGELRVIAGDRADGVKPKEVRIDEHNGYEYTKNENHFRDNRTTTNQEGKVGTEYDVTVTWEDGTTTTKRVTLKQGSQTVYMDDAYSY